MKSQSRMVSIIVTVLGLTSIGMPVLAEGDGACRDDVKKLCGDVQAGGGRIADCMKAHESQLSPGCKDNMAEMKEKREAKKKELMEACQADIKQFCANVTPGEGREMACLKSYDDKISASCKEKLHMHGMMGKHKGKHPGDGEKEEHDEGAEQAPVAK